MCRIITGSRGGRMKDPVYHLLMFIMKILSANSSIKKIFTCLGYFP
jgi:hypothetical protein